MNDGLKKRLTRRQFIKGVAGAAALPLLPKLLSPFGYLARAPDVVGMVIAKTRTSS